MPIARHQESGIQYWLSEHCSFGELGSKTVPSKSLRRRRFTNGMFSEGVCMFWSTQTRIDVAGDHQADAFRTQSLTKTALGQWRLATQLAPLEGRVTRMRDLRIARSSFSDWLLRTRMIFRADWVNTLRDSAKCLHSMERANATRLDASSH